MNIKRLTCMFDYDDVLFPLVDPWVNKLNSIHNINVSLNEIIDWDIAKFFPMLTREQVFEPLHNDNFWMGLEPADKGVETLHKIRNEGHRLKIVTSTFYQNIKPKMERLFQCYPFFNWDDVTVTSHKQVIKGDLLVDDNPDNLVGGDYYKVLMDAPHNSSFDDKKNGVVRINKIEEVCEIIDKITA